MLQWLTSANATSIAVWVAAIGVMGLAVRQIVPWLKQTGDAEARLRDSLIKRIERLEDKLERQQARHVIEQRLSNHRLRNVTACFDAILLMLELNPERGPEIVVKIKEMRTAQQAAEAQEMAFIHASELRFAEEIVVDAED